LSQNNLSAVSRGLLSLHRIQVSNVIIILSKAKNCSELMVQDPQFLSAQYHFYKDKSAHPTLETCTNAREIMPIITAMLLEDDESVPASAPAPTAPASPSGGQSSGQLNSSSAFRSAISTLSAPKSELNSNKRK
jgi:hypothetical protein